MYTIGLRYTASCYNFRMSRRQDWTDPKKWRELDMNVQCVFGLYMARLDPFDRLGLSAEASVER